MSVIKHTVASPLKKQVYTLDQLVALGVEQSDVRKCLVDPKRAPLEALRLRKGSNKKTDPTHDYAWGPDVNFLLGLDGDKR